ncbi:MAG: carbohydrate-binding domain-containing protein [Peptococcaceae bacterium]|nr:carbohydrate-binding domain-containing protein [Peptococcaceae bacterium]
MDKEKKILRTVFRAALTTLLALGLALTGCQAREKTGDSEADAAQTGLADSQGPESAAALAALAYQFDDEKSQGQAADDQITAEILLQGGKAAVTGSGAAADGGGVRISAAGTYLISGTLDNGQILVDAGDDAEVTLLLAGAKVICEDNAPVFVKSAAKVWLTLAEETENYISDGPAYQLGEGEDEPDAAVFSKADLAINGSGGLTVTGLYGHGIHSKDALEITGGQIAVTALKEGIKGRDSLAVSDGSLVVTAGEDGLQSDNDQEEDKGFIVITGGDFVIEAGNDGIQAETALVLRGGSFDLTCGGGDEGTLDQDASAKGLKAGVYIQMDEGRLAVDAADDALHCNDSIIINGGQIDGYTGDDGIHADNYLTVNGGQIKVNRCYEGLEAALVTVNGGDIRLTAEDDGINSAGGSDALTTGVRNDGEAGGSVNPATGGGENPETGGQFFGDSPARPGGGDNFGSLKVSCDIVINGGRIIIDADGDGIDANGGVVMNDGTLIVNGPSSGANGALDYDRGFTMNGGTLIAAGSGAMAQGVGSDSAQSGVSLTFDSRQSGRTLFHLEDEAGKEVLTFAPAKDWQNIVVSLPEFREGAVYKAFSGGSHSGEAADGLYAGQGYSGGTEAYSVTLAGAATSVGGGPGGGSGGGPGGSFGQGREGGIDGGANPGGRRGPGSGGMPEGGETGDNPGGTPPSAGGTPPESAGAAPGATGTAPENG